MCKNNLELEGVTAILVRAEQYAQTLPHESPLAQFIINLCNYCRNDNAYYRHYVEEQSLLGTLRYSLFVHHGLSYDKLRLVVTYLDALLSKVGEYQFKPLTGMSFDKEVASLIVRCAQGINARAEERRLHYESGVGEGLDQLRAPANPGRLEDVCNLALYGLSEELINDQEDMQLH